MSAMNVCQVLPIHLSFVPLQWRHNERDGVSNHQHLDCLLSRLLRCTSKKTPKLRVTAIVRVSHRWSVNSPRKGSVTRKMFPHWWRHRIHIKPLLKVVLLTRLTSSLKCPSFFNNEKQPDDYVSMMIFILSKLGFESYIYRADSRLTPSQWETLQSDTVSHWLVANLESAQ